MSEVDPRLLNTVYIISKGRPQCRTAQTLTRINFPGAWFIVCGTNDETLEQYMARWGSERVLVFDFDEQVEKTDTMDNFGFEAKASGACPVRNAVREISWARGELRHWQLDDDYTGFARFDPVTRKNRGIRDGAELYEMMTAVSAFGHAVGLRNVGFPPSTMEVCPARVGGWSRRVFNAHNLPSDPELFTPWVGRMNDDLINAINTWRRGGAEMTVKFMSMNMPPTQSEKGGLTEMYRNDGAVRKTAYAVMACPVAVKLVERFMRCHHKVDWPLVVPKIVSDRFKR